jgi:hypothetical protein
MLVSDFESAGWSIVGLKPNLHSHWQNTHICFHESKHKEQNDQPELACSSFTLLNNSFLPEVYWLWNTADEEEVVELGISFAQEEIRSWLLGSNCFISLFSLVSWEQELSFTTTVVLSLSLSRSLLLATGFVICNSNYCLSLGNRMNDPMSPGRGNRNPKRLTSFRPTHQPQTALGPCCLWVLMIIITYIKTDVNPPSGSFRIRQCNIKQ